ncbi:MAG: hypothetical protein WC635_03100 [Bacteriovorax sp.]|jgi:hypothetical protein
MMKKTIVCTLIVCSVPLSFADSGTLLNQAGNDIDLSSKIQISKQLNLDNPFVIQVFSAWKSMGPTEMTTGQWIELILDKQHEKALTMLPTIEPKTKDAKLISLKQASELYLLYQTKNYQTFLTRWIDLASSSNFLQTEMGVALDQIVGVNSTQMLIDNGFYLTPAISEKLKKIETIPSKLNYSLQAFKALRARENAVAWIGKLDESDPLRMPLAQTALLHYAKDGKLGASGKIIKGIVEPILSKSNNEEELSLYFMTLGRLLYQAGAMSESKKYYDLIPETSSYFLKAKTEALWAHLRDNDFARTKGELATLELSMFNDKFYPEAYVISAMANVMLCQFNESRSAINRFIEVNKKWAGVIEKNLKDPKAVPITPNFFIANLERAKNSIQNEKMIPENMKKDTVLAIDESIRREISSQWKNRKTMLESALYKMKFVKIELISRMRAVEMNMKIAGSDEVRQQSAAPVRNNQISFPRDGALWGDELFHMSAAIKNKCIQGKLK